MNGHALKVVPQPTIDEAVERIERELPGYEWAVRKTKMRFFASLSSPDLKIETKLVGGLETEVVERGIRIQGGHESSPACALMRALLIAKDQIKLGKVEMTPGAAR